MATMECPVERKLAGKLPLARQKGKERSQLRGKLDSRRVSIRRPAPCVPDPGSWILQMSESQRSTQDNEGSGYRIVSYRAGDLARWEGEGEVAAVGWNECDARTRFQGGRAGGSAVKSGRVTKVAPVQHTPS